MAQDKPIHIPALIGGLNSGFARDLIDLSESPRLSNFTVKDGVARKRTGYATNSGAGWSGLFWHGHHYQDGVSGAKRFIGLGSTKVQNKATIGGAWTDITGGQSIQGGDDFYWTTTEVVELDDYKNYLICCQADSKRVGGTFVQLYYLDTPIYTDVADPDPDTGVLKVLAGGDDYNDGTGHDYHYCKRAINFGDHLLLLHPKEYHSAAWYDLFQRVRWSDRGHFTDAGDWDDVNTDAAGYQDLKTDFGAILNGEVLRSGLFIYLEQAIYACYYTGVSTAPFQFNPMISGLGLYGPRLLASNGESHFFVGSDQNIYQYYGGRDKVPIGDKVKTDFFNNLNMAASTTAGYLVRDRSFAFILHDIEAVVFAIPTGTDDTGPSYPTLFYVYFWRTGRWEKWDYAVHITGVGNFERSADTSNQPILGASSGSLYQIDYSSTNDGSTAIDSTIETKDFVIDLKNEYNVTTVSFEASGDGAASSVEVSISTDGGNTFGSAYTVTVGTTWDLYRVDFNTTGYLLRVKFRNNTAGQKLLLGGVRIDIQDTGEA